jgi:hypothetical protein
MEQKVFQMIVEMAYEMKYANRYCEARRTNLFDALLPSCIVKKKEELPFETEYKDYDKLKKGDIVVIMEWEVNSYNLLSRISKVIRINKKSISLADCDQDGQMIEYNPDEYCHYPTKEARKNYNKLFEHLRMNYPIITGTKHLRYDGWDA